MIGREVALCVVVSSLFFLGDPPDVRAEYASIQHSLLDNVPDTTYAAGILRVQAPVDTANNLYLNDPSALPGVVSNTTLAMEAFFDSYDPLDGIVSLTGGSYHLTFDYDGVTGYELSAQIELMELRVVSSDPTPSLIRGGALLRLTSVVLPGSDDWPAIGGYSTIYGFLTVLDGMDLSEFDWEHDVFEGGESTYVVYPIPEPATILLGLLMGFLILGRRHLPIDRTNRLILS